MKITVKTIDGNKFTLGQREMKDARHIAQKSDLKRALLANLVGKDDQSFGFTGPNGEDKSIVQVKFSNFYSYDGVKSCGLCVWLGCMGFKGKSADAIIKWLHLEKEFKQRAKTLRLEKRTNEHFQKTIKAFNPGENYGSGLRG